VKVKEVAAEEFRAAPCGAQRRKSHAEWFRGP